MLMMLIVGLNEMESDERQRENGVGAPQNDGDANVDEGHENERKDVEDEEVENGVDAPVLRQRVDTERRVGAGRDDFVGDQPRQRVDGTHQPRAADQHAVDSPHSAETTHQHRMLDGDVSLERDEQKNKN